MMSVYRRVLVEIEVDQVKGYLSSTQLEEETAECPHCIFDVCSANKNLELNPNFQNQYTFYLKQHKIAENCCRNIALFNRTGFYPWEANLSEI
jgi:hypothetical protein